MEGLPGITRVTPDLATDRFTITAAAQEPPIAAMLAAIAKLGFTATEVGAPPAPRQPTPAEPAAASRGAIPGLVQQALDRAARERKLVLVDFSANW